MAWLIHAFLLGPMRPAAAQDLPSDASAAEARTGNAGLGAARERLRMLDPGSLDFDGDRQGRRQAALHPAAMMPDGTSPASPVPAGNIPPAEAAALAGEPGGPGSGAQGAGAPPGPVSGYGDPAGPGAQGRPSHGVDAERVPGWAELLIAAFTDIRTDVAQALSRMNPLYSSAEPIRLKEEYLSGTELCAQHQGDLTGEIPRWVSVPVDYKTPGRGETRVYAFTTKPFDPGLPSMIYFAGGPGSSSHSIRPLIELERFNVIFFEQRGVSCSKPDTRELFMDPGFYSSENTARDAERIMRAYGIGKISVYGQSYGTVPATMFASLFPERTRALVLEGVVFEGGAPLWLSKRRDGMLQGFFEGLPAGMRRRILELSRREDIPPNWFSHIGRKVFFGNEAEAAFRQMLDSVLSGTDESIKSFIMMFYQGDKIEEDFSYGSVMNGMLACQELGAGDPSLSMTTVFDRRDRLVKDHFNDIFHEICVPLGLTGGRTKTYSALDHPVLVPTTYFLGMQDSTTDFDQGMAHYNSVARAFKQALVMEKGGHLTNLGLLKDNYPCDESAGKCHAVRQNKMQVLIFEEALMGQGVDPVLIDMFNRSGPLKWSPRPARLERVPEAQGKVPEPGSRDPDRGVEPGPAGQGGPEPA